MIIKENIFKDLQEIIKNSYSPYSNFAVSSIVFYEDGSIFKGVNVENSSFGGSICAERNAILNAVTNGKGNSKIKEVNIYAQNSLKKLDNSQIVPPCGICMQFISQFSTSKTLIKMWNNNGEFKEILFNSAFPINFFEKKLL